ncbi:MAG TPA: hypothetical protein VGI74_01435, partial [Streptosporangiaceae bacterium]
MTWLTWRQFRAQTIAATAVLVLLAVLLAVTGPQLAHLYGTSGIATCKPAGCRTVADNFMNKLPKLTVVIWFAGIAVMYAAPALIGVFWGAPLVTREIEGRTLPLAWNQSVTRAQWAAIKLGLIGLASMATAGLLSLMLTWWSGPLDQAAAVDSTKLGFTRLGPLLFATRGIAPAGYAAFAFALGVIAGVLIRRTIPAMAATLAGFVAVQFAWPNWIRPHLITPVHTVVALVPASVYQFKTVNHSTTLSAVPNFAQHGAWVLSSQIIGKSGRTPHLSAPSVCFGNNINGCNTWIA